MGFKNWWKKLSFEEKGTIFGFLIGAYLLSMSYSFDLYFNKIIFCLVDGSGCIRYVALLPLIMAFLGWVLGFIISKMVKVSEEVSGEKKEKKEYVEKLQKARKRVKEAKEKGYNEEQIKERFRKSGWNEEQISKVV